MALYFSDGSDFDSAGNKKAVQYHITSNITLGQNAGFQAMQGNNLNVADYVGGAGSTFASSFSIGNSSGQVTFPETGLYYISLNGDMVVTSNNVRSAAVVIKGTTNNFGNTAILARRHFCINRPTGTTSLQQVNVEYLFDVQDTTTHKIICGGESDNIGTCYLQADSNMFLSGFTIIKLRGT